MDQLTASLDAVTRTAYRSWPSIPTPMPAVAACPTCWIARSTAVIRSIGPFRTTRILALLAGAAAMVGNSSSGLIEAPMLGVPVVNVGTRQQGRTRGDNVIDVPTDADAITLPLHVRWPAGFRVA